MERRVALLAAVAVLLVATPLSPPTDLVGARQYRDTAEPVAPSDAVVPGFLEWAGPLLVRLEDQVYRVTQRPVADPFRSPLVRWPAKLGVFAAGLALVWTGWGRRDAPGGQE
jgi:hypothetical protein